MRCWHAFPVVGYSLCCCLGFVVTAGWVLTVIVPAFIAPAHYGATCFACGFSFGEVYGETADGFIHVHHLKAIAGPSRRVRRLRSLKLVHQHSRYHGRRIQLFSTFLQPSAK